MYELKNNFFQVYTKGHLNSNWMNVEIVRKPQKFDYFQLFLVILKNGTIRFFKIQTRFIFIVSSHLKTGIKWLWTYLF